jgi:hypothetical protein
MWEILDPSNYEYNTDLGLVKDDSGSGPPTHLVPGWVRTGNSSGDSPVPGQANCDAWSASDSDKNGTTASLPGDWISGNQDLNVWHVAVESCDTPSFVWCVQEYWPQNLYLPAVMVD